MIRFILSLLDEKKLPQTSGIYLIRNKTKGKFYIGSTFNFRHRWASHKCNLRVKRKCANPKLQAAWNKYGEEDFEFLILLECPDEYLIDCEQWYIDNLKPVYNIREEASTNKGFRHSQQTRDKIGQASVELWKTKKLTENAKKPIICYNAFGEFIKEYDSAVNAAKELNLFPTNVTRVLKQKIETIKGYHFRYKTSNDIPIQVELKRTNYVIKLRGETQTKKENNQNYQRRKKEKKTVTIKG